MLHGIRVMLLGLMSVVTPAIWGAEMHSEIDRLKAADAAWSTAAAAGNVDEILTFWADDAVNYFPGAPPVRGKAAIEALVRQNRSRKGFRLTWKAADIQVAESGELGYTSGPFTMTLPLPSGEVVERGGHYVCIWRKDSDGRWRCILETSVSGPELN